jgi:hypothetical protein
MDQAASENERFLGRSPVSCESPVAVRFESLSEKTHDNGSDSVRSQKIWKRHARCSCVSITSAGGLASRSRVASYQSLPRWLLASLIRCDHLKIYTIK